MSEAKKEAEPAVYSEDGVAAHEDGSVTMALRKPINVKDVVVSELKFREPTAADLESIGNAKNEHTAQIMLIANLTGAMVSTIKALPAKEYMRANRIVLALMGKAPPDGLAG